MLLFTFTVVYEKFVIPCVETDPTTVLNVTGPSLNFTEEPEIEHEEGQECEAKLLRITTKVGGIVEERFCVYSVYIETRTRRDFKNPDIRIPDMLITHIHSTLASAWQFGAVSRVQFYDRKPPP